MLSITEIKKNEKGWVFEVVVIDDDSTTSHQVTLTKRYFDSLKKDNDSPADLIKSSFEFLLEREPKESILKEFNLSLIQNHFPEY